MCEQITLLNHNKADENILFDILHQKSLWLIINYLPSINVPYHDCDIPTAPSISYVTLEYVLRPSRAPGFIPGFCGGVSVLLFFYCVVFLLFVASLIFYLSNCFVCASCGQTHFVLCFCFVCFRRMSPMMSVTLVCPFFISHLIFTNVYLQGHRLPGC